MHEVTHAAPMEIDRIAPTRRPAGRPAGCHRWSNLLFVHWRLPPAELEPLLPARLSVDTFDGDAWVGFVAFHMSGVRPWWFPAVPGISVFHETNLRTYVHLDGRDPGVWFFSLDASSSLAVKVARRRWRLPYYRSSMLLERSNSQVRYESHRLWPGQPGFRSEAIAEIGEPIGTGDPTQTPGKAVPGTLEHFLAERYILYAQSNDGTLHRGHVHHSPYPLREAKLLHFEETLRQAASIPGTDEPAHVLFSDGVSVDIFGLRPAN